MTDEELKEKLQYIIDHGMFRAVEDGMWCPFWEILNRIEELEAWKLAVDYRLVVSGCNTADSYGTAADALDALIKQEIALATDPLINGRTDDDG
tara:strand:+ start:786 stop:1067 length:282 start_codon:yes stop_codon:yes gene_type:complete